MIRRLFALALLALPLAAPAQSVPPPPVAARAWLLLDHGSNQPLAADNADQRVEPASLTKLMTAYLSFAALRQKRLAEDQAVPVSEKAWKAQG
jgi:D-alanyl-D-alanine carboxypeptidase (penicillin-binding protein 5/6)